MEKLHITGKILLNLHQTKPFIILAILRRSV